MNLLKILSTISRQVVGFTARSACAVITGRQMGEYLHHAQWSYGIFVLSSLALVLSLMMFFGWAAILALLLACC